SSRSLPPASDGSRNGASPPGAPAPIRLKRLPSAKSWPCHCFAPLLLLYAGHPEVVDADPVSFPRSATSGRAAMTRRRRIYEGKAKVLFEGPEPGTLVQYFKDDASAFNNQKRGTITGKGVLNNRISEYLMQRLNDVGVPTHFLRRLNMREQLVREVEIIPLEIVVRNVAAGSLAKRFGLAEGTQLPRSIVEFYYKSDELGDPMVSEEHITAFGWANPQDIDDIMQLSLRINDFLSGLFLGVGLKLVD